MNNPLFLDLPKEEQENWKFLYKRMCQFFGCNKCYTY